MLYCSSCRRDNCRENHQCEKIKDHYSDKLFVKKCGKPQAETFRDGSKTEVTIMNCNYK